MVRKSPPLYHLFEQPDVPSQDCRTLQGNRGNAGLLTDEEMEKLNVYKNDILGMWNYTIKPKQNV